MQVSCRVVRLDQCGVGDGPGRVGGVLVVGQDLLRGQLGAIQGELIHPSEVRVQAGAGGVVVVADGQCGGSADRLGGVVVVRVGGVARGRAVCTTGPGALRGLLTVDVHRDGGVHHVRGVIDHHDVGPLADLVRHAADHIETGAAAAAAEHAEVPAHGLAAVVFRVRLALEEDPTLAVRPGIGIPVVHRTLTRGGLVAGRIEPGLDGERFGVGRVQARGPRNLGPGSEVEEGRTSGIPCDGPGNGVDASQILGGVAKSPDASGVLVDDDPIGLVTQPVIRGRSVCQDGCRVIGSRQGVWEQGGRPKCQEARGGDGGLSFHDGTGADLFDRGHPLVNQVSPMPQEETRPSSNCVGDPAIP